MANRVTARTTLHRRGFLTIMGGIVAAPIEHRPDLMAEQQAAAR